MPNKPTDALLPCPFCGQGSAYRCDHRGGEWSHDAPGCFLNGVYIAGQHSVEQWNTRPTPIGSRIMSTQPTDAMSAEAIFTEYFARNYPGPHTIIGNPNWHAPKIFRAAQHAMQSARTPPPCAGDDVERLRAALAIAEDALGDIETLDMEFEASFDTIAEAMAEVSDRASVALARLRAIAALGTTPCPSCGGLNTSCPDGCGRDLKTGELDGSRITTPSIVGQEKLDG